MEFYDDYDHPDERIEYILENDLMPPSANTKTLHPPNDGADDDDADVDSSYRELAELFDSRFTLGCTLNCCCCTSAASDTAKRCPCARDCRSATATNYVRLAGTESELILNPMRVSHDLLYECGAQCACPPGCGNRLLQFGPRRDLHIVQTAGKRWGVVYAGGATTNRLAAGAFVCEYVGEVLTASEASRRHASAEYAAVGGNYVLCLREQLCGVDGADAAAAPTAATTVTQTFIDPTRRGNVGRYLNHSCEPNCEIISVRVDGPIPRVGECISFWIFEKIAGSFFLPGIIGVFYWCRPIGDITKRSNIVFVSRFHHRPVFCHHILESIVMGKYDSFKRDQRFMMRVRAKSLKLNAMLSKA